MENKELANNTESEVAAERGQFTEDLDRLAENLADLPDADEIPDPVPTDLKGRIEALKRYFGQRENLFAFSVVAGNAGASLLDIAAAPHLTQDYEILRSDPVLQDALEALGVGTAVAAFRRKFLEYGPKFNRILGKNHG